MSEDFQTCMQKRRRRSIWEPSACLLELLRDKLNQLASERSEEVSPIGSLTE